jgi:hypothetical protein
MAVSEEVKAFIEAGLQDLKRDMEEFLDEASSPEERAMWKEELIRQMEKAIPGLKVPRGERS